MRRHETTVAVRGPWSLATSRAFWEGFSPSALRATDGDALRTVFRVERDWSRAAARRPARGTRRGSSTGDGDLDAAARSLRFLDARRRRPRLARRRPPRSCDRRRPGAAARAASLRVPLAVRGGRLGGAVPAAHCASCTAAGLRDTLVRRHGDDGAFPAPAALRTLDLDLPGRKAEYLHAVAEAALDGRLDGAALRAVEPEEAVATVRKIKGLGPFAAELVVLRGANAPDGLPTHERRLDDEVTERYGRPVAEVSQGWRPFRTWAAVHLRALREQRTHEIGG